MQVNNRIYDDLGHAWWDDEGDPNLVSLRYLTNPIKAGYIRSFLPRAQAGAHKRDRCLDVGSGGGYLSEDLADMELRVTGIDPSPRSIVAARRHARLKALPIDYVVGCGERLPFAANSFEVACCCDVLEHVADYASIVKEIARVLAPGGLFFYDTINRTWLSRLVMITIMQKWRSTAFLDPDIHVWEKFIKPQELLRVLNDYGLIHRDIKGLSPSMNPVAHFFSLRRRAQGRLSWPELADRLAMRISSNKTCTYIGYAQKKP